MITLSRYKLQAFLACQRRFQLRYENMLPWPIAPQQPEQVEALAHGEQFHRLLERHFLGLPTDAAALPNPLRSWWQTWQSHAPHIPAGRRLPEFRLTVPISQQLLLGRFDLLVLGEDSAHIYDWKTERKPRSAAALRHDLQTRLYLALVAEGGTALQQRAIPPENIHLTYWFVQEPTASVSFRYSHAEHDQNWADLNAVVTQIESKMADPTHWPLTNDLRECGYCAYQLFCARPQATTHLEQWHEEMNDSAAEKLEPELP